MKKIIMLLFAVQLVFILSGCCNCSSMKPQEEGQSQEQTETTEPVQQEKTGN